MNIFLLTIFMWPLMQEDHNKIFVNPTFTMGGITQDTLEFLQTRLDEHLGQITYKPESHRK
jgi:hypothetical protein